MKSGLETEKAKELEPERDFTWNRFSVIGVNHLPKAVGCPPEWWAASG